MHESDGRCRIEPPSLLIWILISFEQPAWRGGAPLLSLGVATPPWILSVPAQSARVPDFAGTRAASVEPGRSVIRLWQSRPVATRRGRVCRIHLSELMLIRCRATRPPARADRVSAEVWRVAVWAALCVRNVGGVAGSPRWEGARRMQ